MYQIISYDRTHTGKPVVHQCTTIADLVKAAYKAGMLGKDVLVKEYEYSDERGVTCTHMFESDKG